MANENGTRNIVNNAVAEGGAYEIIRQRLVQQGNSLEEKTTKLNQARIDEFGSTEMSVVGRTRVRTENNCVGRDIVQVGDLLLFGYNVFIGLKKTTTVEDVFALYRLVIDGEQYSVETLSSSDTFLSEPRFRSEFVEPGRVHPMQIWQTPFVTDEYASKNLSANPSFHVLETRIWSAVFLTSSVFAVLSGKKLSPCDTMRLCKKQAANFLIPISG